MKFTVTEPIAVYLQIKFLPVFCRNLKRDSAKFTFNFSSLSILSSFKRHSLDSWRYRTREKKGGSKYTRYQKTMTSRSRSDKRSSFTLITRLLSPEMFLKPLFEVISLEKKISTLNVPRKLALVHFNFTASQSKSIDSGVGLNNDKNDVQSCLKNYT